MKAKAIRTDQTLYMAMELSNTTWKLAFTTGEQNPREINVPARGTAAVQRAIARTKEKFGLAADTPVKSCYEAGRDGFWLHRFLASIGVDNLVVDPASIEKPRKHRAPKTDRLDAQKLLTCLMRHWRGEKRVWGVARVPTEAEEDERRLHRESERLHKERSSHMARIKSLLVLHGIGTRRSMEKKERIPLLKMWDGRPIPEAVRQEIEREYERLELLKAQIKALRARQARQLASPQTPGERKAQKMHRLKGVGPISALTLGKEFFGWRDFKNRREVGALAGLAGSPYASGDMDRDQGITKTGNRWIRRVMIELSWNWLKFQPESELSRWFRARFAENGKRMRRVGIVALARKLLVALWKYVDRNELPAGAELLDRGWA